MVRFDSSRGEAAETVLNKDGKPQDRYISENVSSVIGENTRKILKNKQKLRKSAEPLIQTSDGRIFVKEGTILGRTYTDNGFEERRIRDEDTAVVRPCLQKRLETNSIPAFAPLYAVKGLLVNDGVLDNLQPNEYPTGNYMRLILRTAEDGGATGEANSISVNKDNVIENCEDYIKIDKIEDASNVTKILYMGDSQMYCNDLGGQLAALARKSNRKMVAVCAYNDGASLDYIDNDNELKTACWITRDGALRLVKGKGDINDIMKEDYGGLDRSGKWDYIVVPGESVESIQNMYNYLKRSIKDSKNFVIWCKDNNPNAYKALAEELKCSVVCAGAVWNSYPNQGLLTIGGGNPSGVKQYMSACILHAKLFGKSDLMTFIPLYNKDGGRTSDFYKIAEYNDGGDGNKCNVDEKRAKEIQDLVKEHYEDGALAIN